MHELGITESVIKEIIRQAEKNNIKKIDKVSLSVGDQSNLTFDSIEFCFKNLAKKTILADTKLEFKNCSGNGIVIESIEGIN